MRKFVKSVVKQGFYNIRFPRKIIDCTHLKIKKLNGSNLIPCFVFVIELLSLFPINTRILFYCKVKIFIPLSQNFCVFSPVLCFLLDASQEASSLYFTKKPCFFNYVFDITFEKSCSRLNL